MIVFIAYVDESGDNGLQPNSSGVFILSCVLTHESSWLQNLDSLISLRRYLKQRWNINPRKELKAQYFRWGHGAFSGLNVALHDRMNIYKDVMEYQANNTTLINFAACIDKPKINSTTHDIRYWAWMIILQRINRFCIDRAENRAIIFPDEGNFHFARRLMRQMRRIHTIKGHYGGKLNIPTQLIVEDPHCIKSSDSYFIQLADLNAYAARRSQYIEPTRKVRRDLWDKLGATLLLDVNKLTGGYPPGIVKWP